MKRWLFNIFAFMSLLVCIATTGMWIRSYFAGDRWTWPNPKWKPPGPPSIQYGEGHIDFRNRSAPLTELKYAGSLVVYGNRVINSVQGVVEFVIDTPPWPRVKPFHASYGLKPEHFMGEDAALRVNSINSRTVTVRWSLLGFSRDDISGYVSDSILPKPGTPKDVLIKRWTVPYWPLAVLCGILPILWLRLKVRTWSRHKQGHCPVCGYDLRATPEQCPECGEPMAAAIVQKNAT